MTEAAAQFALTSIGQISINVHDVKRATGFYRDTLGMKFLFEAGHMAFFDCGGVRLMLSTPDKPEFIGDITAASNTTPISITSQTHGLFTGAFVQVQNVGGNTAANGFRTITVTGGITSPLASSSANSLISML